MTAAAQLAGSNNESLVRPGPPPQLLAMSDLTTPDAEFRTMPVRIPVNPGRMFVHRTPLTWVDAPSMVARTKSR